MIISCDGMVTGLPSCGFEVVRGQHQQTGLSLCLSGQRNVHCHLVAVEVGVEGGTYQRMQTDGAALDEDGLERLDAQTVQGRRAVQQHRMVDDDLLQHVPNLGRKRSTIA